MIDCPKAEKCPYSEIMEWKEEAQTRKVTPVFWCHKELKEPKDCPYFDEDYDCVACAHDGDSNICNECENGSKYLKWRTV